MSAFHLNTFIIPFFIPLLPLTFFFSFVAASFSPAASMHVVSKGECIEQLKAMQDGYSGGNGGNVCQSIEHCDFGLGASGYRTLIACTQ